MKLGSTDIADVKLGSSQVQKVMRGSNLVWQKSSFDFGNALILDTTDDFVNINNDWAGGSNQASINFWVKPDINTGANFRISKSVNANNRLVIDGRTGDQIFVFLNNGVNYGTSLPYVIDGSKLMVTVVFDGSRIQSQRGLVYINSVFLGYVEGSSTLLSGGQFNIGMLDMGQQYFGGGTYTHLAFHNNKKLSQAEITNLYNNGDGADYIETVSQPEHYFTGDIQNGETAWVDHGSASVNGVLNNFSSPPPYVELF